MPERQADMHAWLATAVPTSPLNSSHSPSQPKNSLPPAVEVVVALRQLRIEAALRNPRP